MRVNPGFDSISDISTSVISAQAAHFPTYTLHAMACNSLFCDVDVGDWRLPDNDFLASFSLPSSRPETLTNANPIPGEDRLKFFEDTHTYTYDGVVVPRSVTGLLHQFASEFDPHSALAVLRSGSAWVEKRAALEAQGLGIEDDDILQRWNDHGRAQRARGTLMHYHCDGGAIKWFTASAIVCHC